MIDLTLAVIPAAAGFLAGMFALLLVLWLQPVSEPVPSPRPVSDPIGEPRRFRFRNGYLLSHSGNVGYLLPAPIDRLSAWDALRDRLSVLVPDAAAALRALQDTGQAFNVRGIVDGDQIEIVGHVDGTDLRLCVAAVDLAQTSVRIDHASLRALNADRALLASVAETSPTLSWATDAEGRVCWANAAYRAQVAQTHGPDTAEGWPIAPLFAGGAKPISGRSRRTCPNAEGQEQWYDVVLSPPDAQGLHQGHAVPIQSAVRTEDSLRATIQTLTKSFADLPVGLAVFDRDAALTLFNPAFLDLTGIDGARLSGRPRLTDLFGMLRARRMVPQTAEFDAWLADTRSGGAGPTTQTWAGPDGRGFRFTARPHDDGTTALILEDVTAAAEADAVRNKEAHRFQTGLDLCETGVIAFDADGNRQLHNAAVGAIWSRGQDRLPVPRTLAGCLTLWASMTRPTPLWGEIRALVQGPLDERAAWEEEVRLAADDSPVAVRVAPDAEGGLALSLRTDRVVLPLPDAPTSRTALRA